jgi:hypothetical protein
MGISGMKSGMAIRGMNSGRLSGNSLAGIESGYRSGMHNNLPEKQKMLNPINLTGDKKPLIYGLADFFTTPGGNTTNLNDIANTGNYWISNSSSSGNRPISRSNKLNGKNTLVYDGSQSVMKSAFGLTSSTLAGYTIMAVVKMNARAGATIFDNNSIDAGGFLLSNPPSGASPLRMMSRFYSQSTTGATYISDVGPTTSSSIANTPAEFHDYMIVTSKIRLIQPSGPGSEQDLYINGRRHHILSGVDSFSETSLKKWAMSSIGIGNNPGIDVDSLAQGFEMAMGLVLPYWVENSEQEKIENYFRWYYNKSF